MVFALIVGWFCYLGGYGCISKGVLGRFRSVILFLPGVWSAALLKREYGERDGINEDGKACDNEQGNIFSCFFL